MIKKYLAYLKDISRKIISDSGFEKALLDKGRTNRAFTFQTNSLNFIFSANDNLFDRLRIIDDYLNKNNDKKLFCGFGLIAGYKGRQYAAPIIFVECAIAKDNGIYSIEFDFDTASFNYDLVTSILNYNLSLRYSVADDEEFSEDFQKEVDLVDKVENELKKINDFNLLNQYATVIFSLMQTQLSEFTAINEFQKTYSFEEENQIFNKKPKKNRKDKKEPEDTRPRKSIFECDLAFIDSTHFFVNSIPHQLSTYEALRQLILEVESNDFQNEVLQKLLTNVLLEKKVDLTENEKYDIEKLLRESIPLTFSDSQIASIKNAFCTQISYIQGPPGTGKSYTIGAIVLCALFLKKKVLLVSQKDPALDVIKDNIEDFLTNYSDDDFHGITYYKNTNKTELKNNITNLRKHGNNQPKLNEHLKILENNIAEEKKQIEKLVKEINYYENTLAENLKKEFYFTEKHKEFIKKRDWFAGKKHLNTELKLNSKYSFKNTNFNVEPYYNILKTVEQVTISTPTLATELYKHKFKNHIKDNFSINTAFLPDISLFEYCKDLIELHHLHSESHKVRRRINIDNDQIREKLDYLQSDLIVKQKNLIKKLYRYQTLNQLSSNTSTNAIKTMDNLNLLDNLLYWKKPSRIANKMSEIDYDLISDIMPFWLAETRYLGQVLPMKAEMFDLVIVDESSQVNLAEVLPAFYRGKQICIVGDHEQLGLDSTGVNFRLSNRFDNLIWEKNFFNSGITFAAATDKKLTVTQCSILDFVRSPYNKVSIRTEMLKEHFRSMPALAKYTNTNFYDGLLKIMTETPDKISKDCFKVIQVDGKRDKQDKTILNEAEKILDIVQELASKKEYENLFSQGEKIKIPNFDKENFSLGIISLMSKQRDLINDLIEERILPEIKEKHKIAVWTPQSAQGNERDIIILSLCLDLSCSGKGNYYKNNRLLNVATSRAKKFTIVVHCGFQQDKYSQLRQYLNLTANKIEWTLTHSLYASEFEQKVSGYLRDYIQERQDKADIRIYNQVETCGQKRLDFVLFNQANEKAVALEVDGSFHYQNNGLTKLYSKEHTDRIATLKRAGWKIINTPYYKWYRNGWLCDIEHPTFKNELDRIYFELDFILLT